MTAPLFFFGSPSPTLRPMWRPSTAEAMLLLDRAGPRGLPWRDVRVLLPGARIDDTGHDIVVEKPRPEKGHGRVIVDGKWSALAFWGHHIDERPDACCVFVVNDVVPRFFPFVDLVQKAFPEVVGHLPFNIVPFDKKRARA